MVISAANSHGGNMRELTTQELSSLHGAGPSFFKVVGGVVFGSVIGGTVGFLTAGPPGLIAGVVDGAITGAGSAVIKESSEALYDVTHDPNFQP